jgi:hypothetical protein
LRGGDAVLARLAELQRRHDAGEGTEHEVVEELHGGSEARSPGKERERVVGFWGGDWLGFIRRTGWHSVRRERDFGTDGRGGGQCVRAPKGLAEPHQPLAGRC